MDAVEFVTEGLMVLLVNIKKSVGNGLTIDPMAAHQT